MLQRVIIHLMPLWVLVVGPLLLGPLSTLPKAQAAGNAPVSPLPAAPTPGASTRHIAPLFTPEVRYWESQIVAWAKAAGLDPDLVATVMQIESCGNPEAVSPVGARGLFQVMPFHFQPDEVMHDPQTNALRGLGYLARALQLAQGDVRLALAGYNGGHSVIGLDPAQWPAETQRYAQWGSGIYADAKAGLSESPTQAAWLAAGGASLCRQAHARLGLP